MPKKIKVHEKALGHLSRGLYRSPASALRELVSNAWDGNATVVRINTNYPNFFQISVEDNGEGFTKETFAKLMEGGIGNSPKRPAIAPLMNDRPLIGRIGIGMLGIAQVCGNFTITSRPKKGEGFRAKVNLYDLLKSKLDQGDETATDEIVEIGEYDFDDEYDLAQRPNGTLILTNAVHPTFVDPKNGISLYEIERQRGNGPYKMLHFVMDVRRQDPPLENRAPDATPPEVLDAYRDVVRTIFRRPETAVTNDMIDRATLESHLGLIKSRRAKYLGGN